MDREQIKIHSFETLSPNIVYERLSSGATKRIFIVDGLKVDFAYKTMDSTIIIQTDRVISYEEMKDKIIEELEITKRE